MRILLSPIGTADPLTMLGDGPMLHIARHYSPDKIFLLFSDEMFKYEEEDNRYTKAIIQLANIQGRELPEIKCVKIKEKNIARHDLLIPEFQEKLRQIRNEYPEAEIFLNLSSGTPAMEEALLVLHAFNLFNTRAFQVPTPTRKRNEKGDREDPNDYSFDELWELYLETGEGDENRCQEDFSQNFRETLIKDNIRTLIKKYDFVGALELAQGCGTVPDRALDYIKGAVERTNLKKSETAKVSWSDQTKYNPEDELYEYLSVLEVYLWREQWADFLRALTPALFVSLHNCVRKYLKDDDWLVQKETGAWLIIKVKAEKIEKIKDVLDDVRFSKNSRGAEHANLSSWIIIDILECFGQNVCDFRRLRDMEEKVRNQVAHQISSIDKKRLEKDAGISFEDALSLLFKVNGLSKRRGLYKKVADEICAVLQ